MLILLQFCANIFPLTGLSLYTLCKGAGGVKLIFPGGHIRLAVAFKGLDVIFRLYTCNYSLTGGKELGAAAG